MLMTQSFLTNEPAECTIEQGIMGCDGVRRGAIADIDLFGALNIELDDGSDMWENKLIRDRVVINRQTAAVITRRTDEDLDLLALEYEAAMILMAEDGIDPNEDGTDSENYSPFSVDNN